MIKLEIEKENVDALFGESANRQTPTLDDYTTIKKYEDACVALGEKPICFQNEAFIGDLPASIIALIKLETISRALWGRNFQPKPDANGARIYYYPWFAFYTEGNIEKIDNGDKRALLSDGECCGAHAASGYTFTSNRYSITYEHFGIRMCQETDKKAYYFGKQFVNLWAEYFKFNF